MAQTQNPHHEDMGYIPDKVVKAERRIANSPFDTEAWSVLIRDAQMKKIEDARKVYERLVAQFPNAGRYWKIYIEHEVHVFHFPSLESKQAKFIV
jgi:cleavage stimulation factor subunit 3